LTSHPDKVAPELREEATRKFQEVQVAYDVLQDPHRRKEYDDQVFGYRKEVHTPPGSENGEQTRSWGYRTEMPPTPESPDRPGGSWEDHSSFSSRTQSRGYENRPQQMTYMEASLMFRPGDRRQLWLCSDEDDPAQLGGHQITKRLYVSLQEYSILQLF
jgi:DnaJ-class molecular chaperone